MPVILNGIGEDWIKVGSWDFPWTTASDVPVMRRSLGDKTIGKMLDGTLLSGRAMPEELRQALTVSKHYGPDNHKSGTSQDVHGKPGPGQGSLFNERAYVDRDFEKWMADNYPDYTEETDREAYDAWITWEGSKTVRLAALDRARLTEEHTPADPHVTTASPDPSSFSVDHSAEADMYAALYMEGTVSGQEFRKLYRAVDTSTLTGAEAEFWANLSAGDTFDAPLMATLSEFPIVGDTNLLDKFGTNVLIEFDGALGTDSGTSFSSPFWLQSDEDRWLNDIRMDVNSWEVDEDAEEGSSTAEQLSEAIESGDRETVKSIVGDFIDESEQRWAGSPIPEEHDDYYSWMEEADYSDGYPREVIAGGRFEVVSVDTSPDNLYYDSVVHVRQIGGFDPITGSLVEPGHYDNAGVEKKKGPIVLTSDAWQGLKAMENHEDAA